MSSRSACRAVFSSRSNRPASTSFKPASKLLNLFPDRSFRQADIDFYNKTAAREFEQVRDLIVFHYAANGRRGQALWDQCRAMELPDSLTTRMDLYQGYGRVFRTEDELFSPLSWTAVFEGQGHNAETFDPLALGIPIDVIEGQLRQVRAMIAAGVEPCRRMPISSASASVCSRRWAPRQFGAVPAASAPWESN